MQYTFGLVMNIVYCPSVCHITCREVDGELYYSLEYTVRSPAFFRHNISIYATK